MNKDGPSEFIFKFTKVINLRNHTKFRNLDRNQQNLFACPKFQKHCRPLIYIFVLVMKSSL